MKNRIFAIILTLFLFSIVICSQIFDEPILLLIPACFGQFALMFFIIEE
jgi:hypothetical protein